MSEWPKIAFVTAPRRDADVLVDFSTEDVYVDADKFTLGTATLQSDDPEATGVEWGYRNGLQLPVVVQGDKVDARAVLQKIARTVIRAEFWLLYHEQPAEPPRWFHVFRTAPGDMDMTEVTDRTGDQKVDEIWQITVPLNADSLAYGEEVVEGPFTINNDPASGTNPCRVVLPAIKGDVPAPVTLEITPSVDWTNLSPMFTLVSSYVEIPQVVWQAEDFTAYEDIGGDTTAEVANADASGGHRSETTFATHPAMLTRLEGTAAVTPMPGRYRVLARVGRDGISRFKVRLNQFVSGEWMLGQETAFFDRPDPDTFYPAAAMVDLGDFTFPFGGTGWDTNLAPAAAPQLRLELERVNGSGIVWVDYLVLIPVDGTDITGVTTMVTSYGRAEFPAGDTGIWDADRERFCRLHEGDLTDAHASMAGGFAVVEPDRVNVLHLHHTVGGSTTGPGSDDITATATVRFRYHPRYLNLAGDE